MSTTGRSIFTQSSSSEHAAEKSHDGAGKCVGDDTGMGDGKRKSKSHGSVYPINSTYRLAVLELLPNHRCNDSGKKGAAGRRGGFLTRRTENISGLV